MSNIKDQIALQILQRFEQAVSSNNIEEGQALLQEIGPEAFASLDSAFQRGRDGDSLAQSTAYTVADQIIKKQTPPVPVVRPESRLEAFSEAGKKAVLDLGRTWDLREKQLENWISPSPEVEADIRTLKNQQKVADIYANERFKGYDTEAVLGGMAPYIISGAGAAPGLLGSVTGGAALGALQPNTNPLVGAMTGGATAGALGAVGLGAAKSGRAATRKLADIRRASTPEFEQASEISKQLGFRDYTKSPQISHTQETLRRGLMAHLGTEDLSAKGLANTKEAVGREIGAHYRQSNIPLPPSLNDDLDSILQITKAEAGELPTPMATKASQIQDVVMDVGNPDRGAALHSIRQRIGDLASPNLPKPVRDGYRALQQYIDDLALTGLPGGDQAILRGLQKRFGMLSEMSKKRVVDSGTGEVNLPKLQALAEDSFHMRMNPELYDLAQAARASAETEALSIGQSYPAVTEAIARSRSYAARPLLERFTQPIRTIAGTPVPQSGQALIGAGSFGLVPFSMYGQQ